MNKHKSILHIAQITNCYETVPPHNKAGLEQMVHYLIEGLIKKGHQVTLFGSGDSNTSANIVPVWPCAVSHDPASQIRDIGWYTHLSAKKAYTRSSEFDIIHDHTYFESDLYARLVKTPVVTTMHHPVDFETTLINEFPAKYHPYLVDEKYASHVVSVSKHQSAMLKEYLNRDSYVIHNGIPLEQWNEYAQSSGDYFAYLGYISGFKGVGQAIRAILKTDKKLIIAGPVDEHDIASVSYFKNEVEPYLKLGQIEYIGPLNLKEKQKFLQRAVATLMPVQWDEPFGLVAIESLASGTPVIANARGALPEIIEDGVSGYLVESIDGLAEKINQVHVLNRDNTRKRYLEYFTSDKMVDAYEALYYDLIDQHT